MNLSNEEFDRLIFFAFRYSLGPWSTASSIVRDVIRKNRGEITEMTKMAIICEINYAYKNGLLGDECDIEEWLSLKKELENED